jgi:hypothetical protein
MLIVICLNQKFDLLSPSYFKYHNNELNINHSKIFVFHSINSHRPYYTIVSPHKYTSVDGKYTSIDDG